ncbi:hypothetical protein PVAG01_10140 [Phlyctema vagabunda]|uniref:Uncharacterized protein n=1 Tax=Phlyctema vagabunda TaxID=108571 RepID=A0ABR4P534_9HELO
MLLHGILHRIEGDYDNARAWYSDVRDSDVFKAAWNHGGPERAMEFLREIEVLRKETKHPDPKSVQRLEQESLTEFKNVIEFCEKRFGTKGVEDASSIWVQSEKSSGKGSEMVVGGEGWRQF